VGARLAPPAVESFPELPQVMIHVEISPTHPVTVTHGAEHRMRLPFELPRPSCKALQKLQQVGPVALELGRWSATMLRVHLGRVFNPWGHFKGEWSAIHFTNQRGKGIGVTEMRSVFHGFSPIVTRNESLR